MFAAFDSLSSPRARRLRASPSRRLARMVAGVLWLAAAGGSLAAPPTGATSTVYSCIDAQGRRLTSDRPIMECLNRDQRQYQPSGASRVVKPEPTQAERDAQAAREKAAQAEREAAEAQRKRDRLLLARFPTPKALDEARMSAIGGPQMLIKAAQSQMNELLAERKAIDAEMEFYASDRSKAPPMLKRKYADLARRMGLQAESIAFQANEIKRINERFDAQARTLQPMWSEQAGGGANQPR